MGESVPLDAVGGALALCTTDGALIGASRAATELLTQMGGDSTRVPESLWNLLDAAGTGEAVMWSPSEQPGHTLGCTRYPVDGDRSLLVMREITLKQEQLTQLLQKHRAKTVELLVYLLAHDLRAPLASIVFNLDVLRERWFELDPTNIAECLEESIFAAAQLRETIDALVDMVRIGPPRIADLRVDRVIDRVVALTRPLFRQTGHELVVHLDPAAPTIRANELAVQQILVNLLVNAVEASSQPMPIEVSSAPATLNAACGRVRAVQLRVRDYGPGISRELANQLFQPFFTTKPSGTGLGLALARDAAMNEQGELRVVEVDRGACFEIILPAGRAVQ